MATVVQPLIEPDKNAIHAFLTTLFEPCAEHYPGGLIELRYGAGFTTAYFNSRPEGIAEAADFAANRNREGANVYVGVNPRKPATKRPGKADDVGISFWHFTDIDKAPAVEQAGRRMKVLPPTMTVTTGTEPNRRPHLYWQLDYPAGEMTAWGERQRGIRDVFEGDDVIDPSRIMRLAGTVNYPTQDKVGRGYRMELTSFRTKFSDKRPPVSAEQIAAAYPFNPDRRPTSDRQPSQGQNTLQAMSPTGRTQQLISAALAGDHWHNNVRDLVARLARLGRADNEIMLMAPGLTLPGYSVDDTEKEMWNALQSARAKYNLPRPKDEPEDEDLDDGESVFETLSLDELEDMAPPTYLIDGILPEHGLTFLYGDPGAGKSFIALDMALRLAYGLDWHGSKTKQVGVLYIAGEGKHGLGKRVTGWRKEHGMEGEPAPFKLLPVAVHMLDQPSVAKLKRTIASVAAEVGFDIALVIIDTVSRAIPGRDENKQDTMSLFVDGCAELHQFTNGAVIGVHHSGKDKEKGMRGSTVLLGGCETSIKVTKEEKIVRLAVEKQKDDEEAEPIYMQMKKLEWATGLEEMQSTLVPVKSVPTREDPKTLSNEQIGKAFIMMIEAWTNGRPLSHRPETRRDGRYAPVLFAMRFGGDIDVWSEHLVSWLHNQCVIVDTANKSTKAKGLRVIEPLGTGI